MRTSITATRETFKPITLEIVMESEDEARAICAIFNHSRNTKLLKDGGDGVTELLSEYHVGSNNHGQNIIANGVKYDQFYCNYP